MSPVPDRHQWIVQFLIKLLGLYLEINPIGTILQDYTVKLGSGLPVRVPDLAFLSGENGDRNKHTYIEGAVDIAIEIVSLDSRVRDRGEKFYECEQAGVKEYWLIDPLRDEADFNILSSDGKFRRAELSTSGLFESGVLPGLRIDPKWLWLNPLPGVRSISTAAGLDDVG